MRDITTKITGDSLTADEFNDIPSELENAITDTGIALTASDLFQLSKSISNYVAGGSFYTDSGTSTNYTLTPVAPKKPPTAYVNGMSVSFRAGANNTTATPTINVAGLGSKNIVVSDGVPLEIDDISTSGVTTLYYDGTAFTYPDVFASRGAKEYKTVASMVADLGLLIGQSVELTGYTTDGDGGGKPGTVVAGATGTDDGGSFHDLDNGNQFQMTISDTVIPQQWGAVADGIVNDTAACKGANLSSASSVFYPAGTYYCPDETIPFESKKTYFGVFEASFISSDTDSQPVGASRAYLTADGTVAPTGRCVIRELYFIGEKTNTNQIGFVLHDFFSLLDHVTVTSCGGGGIQFTKANDAAVDAGGTLVENRLDKCIVRNCGGTLYDLGESGNAKLTDGFMTNCIADGEVALTTGHIFVGQSAGWLIDGVHLYGSASERAIECIAAGNTKIINFFIEQFERFGVSIGDCQGNTKVSGAFIGSSIDDSGGDVRYVNAGQHGASDDITVDIDVMVNHSNSMVDAAAVRFAGDAISGTCNVAKFNDDNNTLTDIGENATGDGDLVATPYNFKLSSDDQTGQLANGFAFPIAFSSGRLSGNGAQSVLFELPKLETTSPAKMTLDIDILAGINDNGGAVRAEYKAFVMITGKVGSDTGILLTEVVAPTGFSSAPVLTLNDGDTDTPELQIDFTWTNADATGAVTAICVPVQVSE